MRIRDREYLIVREVDKAAHGTQYIFKTPTEDCFYKVLVQEKSSIDGQTIAFLSEQTKNKPFTDFVDYLNDFDNLYVFMQYHEHQTLKDRLALEVCTLAERVEIAKRLLEKIIVLNIPPYFSRGALDVEHIQVSRAGEIFFDYNMQDLQKAHRAKEGQSLRNLAALFEILFQKELDREIMPELETLIYAMKYGQITQVTDVFAQFYPIYRKENPTSESHGLREKIVAKFQKLLKHLTLLTKILVIALAVYYLYATLQAYFTYDYNLNFTQIGIFNI